MNRLCCQYLAPLLLLLLSGCGAATVKQFIADGKNPLSSQELLEQIPGLNLRLEAIDFDAKIQFLPDGHLSATDLANQKEQGKWSVTADNHLCLKFDRWYFGDLNCYQLIRDNGKYIFFTLNGARYYTATSTSGRVNSGSLTSDSSDQGGRNSDRTQQAGEVSAPGAVSLSAEEKKETLVRLARNCPACNLAGVSLSGAQLIAANLAGADLSGADLSGANLRRANLAGADLSDAKLIRTNLSGANLNGCDLSRSNLTGANLIRATVINADLEGAVLDGAYLESIQGMSK